jgi:hypothetical protein
VKIGYFVILDPGTPADGEGLRYCHARRFAVLAEAEKYARTVTQKGQKQTVLVLQILGGFTRQPPPPLVWEDAA